jgi:hypothetical protein
MAKYLSQEPQKKFVQDLETRLHPDMEQKADTLLKAVGTDRTTWFRWKKCITRIPVVRVVEICERLGIDPTDYISPNDTENLAIAKPYQKLDLILPFYKGYVSSGLRIPANGLMVEVASLYQEAMTRNGFDTELRSKVLGGVMVLAVHVYSSSGMHMFRTEFSHYKESPRATLISNHNEVEGDFLMGRKAFIELVRMSVLLDKKWRNANKEEIGALEMMASRFTSKRK